MRRTGISSFSTTDGCRYLNTSWAGTVREPERDSAGYRAPWPPLPVFKLSIWLRSQEVTLAGIFLLPMMAGLPHSASPARSSALLTADILIGHPPRRHQRFSSYIPYFCSLPTTCTDAARQNDERRKPMTTTTMRIARAEPTDEHLKAVLGLVEGAAAWLRYKDTDQWASPWPDDKRRDERVLKGLQVGKTWIIWDGDIRSEEHTSELQSLRHLV